MYISVGEPENRVLFNRFNCTTIYRPVENRSNKSVYRGCKGPGRINFIFQFQPAVEGKATSSKKTYHFASYVYTRVGGSGALLYDYVS